MGGDSGRGIHIALHLEGLLYDSYWADRVLKKLRLLQTRLKLLRTIKARNNAVSGPNGNLLLAQGNCTIGHTDVLKANATTGLLEDRGVKAQALNNKVTIPPSRETNRGIPLYRYPY